MDQLKQLVRDNTEQYMQNLEKVNSGEWSLQQWHDYCSWLMSQIMATAWCTESN